MLRKKAPLKRTKKSKRQRIDELVMLIKNTMPKIKEHVMKIPFGEDEE